MNLYFIIQGCTILKPLSNNGIHFLSRYELFVVVVERLSSLDVQAIFCAVLPLRSYETNLHNPHIDKEF